MVTDLLPRILQGALLLTATWAMSGCSTLYLAQAAQGQMQLLAARRPIERVIADPRTAPPIRAKLEAMRSVRRFAVESLGLPDNASYRSYADIGRPYVVWNVVATPEFSVEPLRWCFPIAGCVAYRGYFKEARAQAFALGLESRGDDAFVGGVPAYSTLGRFADPILSTMIDYPDSDLASVVFHELAHQRVYVAGDSEFNEAFAETVEETGLARWLAALGRSDELARFERRRASQQVLVAIFVRGRGRLRTLYAQPLPGAQMRLRKGELFAAIAAEVHEFERARGVHSGFDDWLASGLNNAHLASVGTYFECVPAFERLLATESGDLPSFYVAVERLARAAPRERRAFCARPAA